MKRISFFTLIASILFFTGCTMTPLTQIDKFAESTDSLTRSTDEVITEYNESNVQAELRLKKVTHYPKRANLTIDDLAAIQHVFGDDEKKELAIYNANKALNGYAKAIKALAQSGNRDDIAKASIGFVESLDGMQKSYRDLTGDQNAEFFSDDQLGVITSTIDLVGTAIAEDRKRDALKDIITKADPHIATLVDEIVKQIDLMDYDAQLTTINTVIIGAKITDYNNRVELGYFKTQPADQYTELESLWKESQSIIVTSKKLKHLKDSLREIMKQHANIAKEVAGGKFDSAEIVAAIKELQAKRKRYDDFKEAIVTCDKVVINDNGNPVCDDDEARVANKEKQDTKDAAAKAASQPGAGSAL